MLSAYVCVWLSFVFAVREGGLFVFGGSGVAVSMGFVCLFRGSGVVFALWL